MKSTLKTHTVGTLYIPISDNNPTNIPPTSPKFDTSIHYTDPLPIIPWPICNILGAGIPLESKNLLEVYSDMIHQHDGTHLAESIVEDAIWQKTYAQLLNVPTIHYHLPSVAVGKRFVNFLTKELLEI